MAEPVFIDTQDALTDALEILGAAGAVAVDTETDAFFAYRPQICLLQLSVPGHDLLVDPLAGLDLDGIGALLADPAREIVLHAAENDVIQMHHQYGWRIARLFDTQVACFVLGLKPYSLAGVLEARFGVKLDKSQQRSDWSQRPLSEKQIRYAAYDTAYLLDLMAELRTRAEDAGRVEEITYECGRIAAREWQPEPFDPEGFRRMGGAKELDGRALRILKGLYLLRNGESERRNRAPYRIVSDQALVALARNGGKRPQKGVPEGFWRRYSKKIEALARKAATQEPLPPARRKRRSDTGAPVSAAVKRAYERLRRWRTAAAEERGVESFVVARNELLMRIAQSGPANLDELGELIEPFRLKEYGAAILAALHDSGDNPGI